MTPTPDIFVVNPIERFNSVVRDDMPELVELENLLACTNGNEVLKAYPMILETPEDFAGKFR